MDTLQALIAAQKQKVADEKKSAGGAGWIQRRKVVERLRVEAEQRAIDEERKRRREETERLKQLAEHLDQKKRRACGTAAQNDEAHTTAAEDAAQDFEGREEAQPPLAKSDVVKKLRRLKEPVTLFGETEWQRYTRLCHLELLHHEDELMGGQRNAFLNPHDDDEEEELDEDDAHPKGEAGDGASASRRRSMLSSSESATSSHPPRAANNDARSTDGAANDAAGRKRDGGDEKAAKCVGSATETTDSGGAKDDKTEQKVYSKETTIVRWIRRMLHEWEAELKARSEEAKNSAEGRFMTSLHRQTRKDVKPLLKKLKRKDLEEDIRDKLYDMVLCCEDRKYRSAHDT